MLNRPADRQFSREYIDFLRIVYHQMVRKGPFHGVFGIMRMRRGLPSLDVRLRHDCDFYPYALDFVSL
jgi:hypothetical protein